MNLAGVFAPIPTPFDSQGRILFEELAANVARWCDTDMNGLVVLGSNGESVMLNPDEKVAVWKACRAAIPPTKLFIAGAGAESVQASMTMICQAADAGADAVLVVTPHYYKAQMTSPVMIDYYTRLADASPIPIIIYNMPRSTGVDIEAAVIIRLAYHPNIVGVKDSSGNVTKLADIVRAVPRTFAVIAGSGGYFYPALCVGAPATVAALANLAPKQCVELFKAFRAGRHDEAKSLQLKLIPVNQAVTARWGVPGLKAALDEQGLCYGGPPRLPLQPLGENDRSALHDLLRDAGLLDR